MHSTLNTPRNLSLAERLVQKSAMKIKLAE